MEQLLMEVAQAGNINALYTALDKDPSLLDEIDKKTFIETPLHVAASSGQTVFALEIMRLKPSFAFKANKDGFSPMHVALQHGQIETTLRLLDIRGDLVRVKGRAGVTPLHYVVEQGDIHLLIQFLSICPKAIEDVTIENETAMHIALKSDKMEAFQVLFTWLEIGCEEVFLWEKKILSWKDNDGNSILQLAMSRRQTQVVKLLKTCRAAKYLDGWTAALNQQVDLEPEDGINVEVEDGINVPSVAFQFLCENKNYLRTDQRLKIAAQEGDTNALNAILWEDPYILERIDQITLVDTPLHIAAIVGKTEFALEILRLKPSFARKVNRDGLSPLHLALENKRFETAFELLAVDKELVHVKAKDGLTPLHYAAKEGNDDLLAELIAACPKSIEDLTARRETALHVAVKNNNMVCLKILCNWLSMVRRLEVLKWTDFEGKNILDIATERKNSEVVKVLSEFEVASMLKLNAEDSQGTRASKGSPLATMLGRKNNFFEMWVVETYRFWTLDTKEDFSMILVAFTLIVTVTYQAVLSPPGGVWQGDPSLLFPNGISNDNKNTATVDGTNAKILNAVGKTIMPKDTWLVFSILNTAAFVFSLQATRRMLFLRNNVLVRAVAYLLVCCYGTSLYVIGPHGKLSIIPIILCVFFFFQSKILFVLYRLMVDRNRVQEIGKVVQKKCARSQD